MLAAIAGPDPADPRPLAPTASSSAAASRAPAFRHRRAARQQRQDPAGGAANFEARSRSCANSADVRDDLELPAYPYDAMASIVIDAECGERLRAAVPERANHRAHRARGPDRRLRRAGPPGQGLPAGAAAPAPRRRGARPAAGTVDAIAAPTLPTVAWPIDAPFDKVYPDYPGGASIGGPANLAGVPGLFLPNGVGEAGSPPVSSSPDEPFRSHAARDRRPLPVPHRASPPPSPGIVTHARRAYILGPRRVTLSAQEPS